MRINLAKPRQFLRHYSRGERGEGGGGSERGGRIAVLKGPKIAEIAAFPRRTPRVYNNERKPGRALFPPGAPAGA